MISAILINFHSSDFIGRAIKSLTETDEDLEIFVLDNTATNEEEERLKKCLGASATLIFNKENLGFARACNIAYTRAKGEYIFLLNPDAYLFHGSLTVMREFLDKNKKAGAVGPRVFLDEDKAFYLPPSTWPSPYHFLFEKLIGGRWNLALSLWWRWIALKTWRTDIPLIQKNLSGGVALLRREAIERAGGLFDERFFLYYEDTDLFFRMRKAGFKLYLEPESEAVHNWSRCGDDHDKKREYMEASSAKFKSKHLDKHPASVISSWLEGNKRYSPGQKGLFLGSFSGPLGLDIPERYSRGEWLVEFSPNENLFPAAGFFGKGRRFIFPQGSWSLLKKGRYWLRISEATKMPFTGLQRFCWDKL
jgi:GT2 family glycosyltransferase